MDFKTRKKNRMDGYDYSLSGAYFVTVCTKDKAQILWENVGEDIILPSETAQLSEYGKVVDEAVNNISICYQSVIVDKYVIMPDHIHMILILNDCSEKYGRILSAPTLSVVIGQMKRWVSKKLGFPIWQKSFHDHIIRNEHDYREICRYIDENPLNYIYKMQMK